MPNKRKEKYVTVCPKCGSSDVLPEQDPAYAGLGFPQFKQCNHCGHHGMIFPEVSASQVPKNPKSAKEIKDIQFVQTHFGKGYLKYWIYIGIPLMTLMLILLLLTQQA